MTGLLGGGHAIYWDAAAGRATTLDCFVTVPGLGAEPRAGQVVELQIPFGAELVHYAVGPATCGVPGLPAGLDALWRAHGRLPWPRLVEPAVAVAHAGAELPPAHAACLEMLAPVMTMNEGAAIYAPGGELLGAGARVPQPEHRPCARARRGRRRREACTRARSPGGCSSCPTSAAGSSLRRTLRATSRSGGSRRPSATPVARVATRVGLSRLPELLGQLPPLRGLSPAERVVALTETLAPAPVAGGVTHDRARGRRLRRQRVRADLEPGARLGRLGARPRPAPEQHARRGRPDPRPARAGRAHGEHDVPHARLRP